MGTLDDILFSLGIYPNQCGYKTTTIATYLAQKQPDILQQVTKQFYPEVARQCNCGWGAVERRIRLSSTRAWNTNQALLCKLARRTLLQPPTASEFICILCKYLASN